MAEQNLSVDIKIKADTSGAKEATKAIDGLTDAIEEQAVAEKELVQETEKVVVEEKKLVEVEKEAEKAVEKTTAAKKKKVVEQKKETAAIEEAVVVEKKAIDTTGMYIDAKGRVHEAGGKFVKVAKEEREGLKEQIKLQENSTVTTNGASQAKEKLAKSSNSGAMGLLALSNAVQDVQYGFGGMVNNIPQIITGLGMGMGVAGAVQIAAVGVQFLLKNVDLFGEKAKEAAKAAAELSGETMADANAAYKAAEATKAQAAAQESLNAALAVTEGHYKAVIALSEQIIKQKQAEKDAETALADAQAGMEMARIALAESRGEMTKEEAIFAKEKVRTEADARKQTAAIALEEGKVAEARRKAAAEDAQANAKRAAAQEMQQKGIGMLTDEEKKLAEENKAALKASMDQSKIDQERFAKQGGAMGKYNLEKERAGYLEMQAAMDRENAKLAADKAAREATGAASPKALRDAIAAQIQAANEGAGRASGLRGEAIAGETGIRQSQRVFGMRQATGAMQAQAQIEAERARRQAEADKAAADRAREVGQVGTAGGSLAATLAGDGISTGFTDSLRKASVGAGDAAGLDRLIAMVAKLTTNSAKLSEQAKSKLDKLEAEIEDLRTAK